MSVNQVNILINNKELIYSKDNNELLMNHLSRTINVEMTIETYNKYKIWMQNGCPIASDTGDQHEPCEITTLSDDIKEAKMLLSNDNNNPDDTESDKCVSIQGNKNETADTNDHENVKSVITMAPANNATERDDTIDYDNIVRGGSGLSVNSSDDNDDEMCKISKPIKGTVIEDDNEDNEDTLHEGNANGQSITNTINESIVQNLFPSALQRKFMIHFLRPCGKLIQQYRLEKKL